MKVRACDLDDPCGQVVPFCSECKRAALEVIAQWAPRNARM
jgi:hypothetical protein